MSSAAQMTVLEETKAPIMTQEQRLNGAEVILRTLRKEGVEVIFGYPGGAVLPIYDALFKQNSIRHILVRHEQAAAHAAEGYARSTGKVGVLLVTSGPGATNAVTGLTDALLDSVPIVCLTGQVATHLIGTDAFQEADTTGITRACTKQNYLVKDQNKLAHTIHEAFYVARSGRPGPVVIDLPKDIQVAPTDVLDVTYTPRKSYQPQTAPDPKAIEAAADLIEAGVRPIIYGGGGLVNSGDEASSLLKEFADLTGFPTTLTLMGLGCLPASHPQFLGMLGMHGTYEANMSMHGSDLIICLGARFDDRITGRLDAFSPNSKRIHFDIDPASIGKNIKTDVGVVGDVGAGLKALIATLKKRGYQKNQQALKSWWQQIDAWRAKKSLLYKNSDQIIKPQYALERLNAHLKNQDFYITTEVGQHQMWAAQYLDFEKPKRWMTSGGLGTMGYGLPAAMGVQIAHPESLVIDVAGEASILMNIQELATLCQYSLPVKIFILNNQWMGMVRQWQELIHGGRYSESYSASLPDFVKVAEAFGGVGLRAQTPAELDGVIEQMISIKRPVIVDVCVDQTENCFPMIPSGAAHNEMILSPECERQEISEEAAALV